ncbi:MAG: tyrosine--tRNA ligase [Patescibacteria group bacterium]
MNKNKEELIDRILEKGTEDIVGKEELREKLEKEETLTVKLGLDPTGKDFHLGHASMLWRLRFFQELGHRVVFIIGDFTAKIGDASDKEEMRDKITDEEIKENMKDYKKQLERILDMDKVDVKYNSQWFNDFRLEELISLAMEFTAQQMIRRRNFKERWDAEKPIGMHEILYPLLQGYDSVAVEADVEIGGFDQLFNLKTGRKIQKFYDQEPQKIITSEMLYGLDGREMSTSWGNTVNITDEPKEMYGKIMSLKDELIMNYFNLCAFYSEKELKRVQKELNEGKNPKKLKKELAKAIVELYYDKDQAKKAEKEFENVFEKGKSPEEMTKVKINKDTEGALNLVYATGLVDSKSQTKRLIKQNAVKIDGEKIKSWKEDIQIKDGMIIKIGKKRFAKIVKK